MFFKLSREVNELQGTSADSRGFRSAIARTVDPSGQDGAGPDRDYEEMFDKMPQGILGGLGGRKYHRT